MRFAVNLPNFGPYADPRLLVDLARDAEEAGWEGFFVWDHVLGWDGNEVADPWSVLAAVASATSRIRLGPMVTPLPRRRPWVLARQAVTVDHLSGGRLVLGVGIGFPADAEFGTFGEAIDERVRGDMLDEGLAILLGMWSGEPFGFVGTHYRVETTTFLPRPVQRPRVPVWVAGMWPAVRPFRRAAGFDGVCPIRADMAPMGPADVRGVVEVVESAGGAGFEVSVPLGSLRRGFLDDMAAAGVTWGQVGPDPEGESPEVTRRWIRRGPPR